MLLWRPQSNYIKMLHVLLLIFWMWSHLEKNIYSIFDLIFIVKHEKKGVNQRRNHKPYWIHSRLTI